MFKVAGIELNNRIFLGTGRYPSPKVLVDSIKSSKTEVVTVSLRRESAMTGSGSRFWDYIKDTGVRFLPNTAGCYNVKDAVTTAHMARELFDTNWIKLEVIGNDQNLQPDPFATVEAAKILVSEGFEVFPYTTEDAIVAEKLLQAGCRILMPWGAPIGTGKGILNMTALSFLRSRFPDVPLVLDAGIGKPSDATKIMEIGFDAVLLNTAVSKADNPIKMAEAFYHAVVAGRMGYEAGPMRERELAVASTPTIGVPFWEEIP
jgi:thiazole synthase